MIIPKQVRKFSKQKNCSSKQCQDNIELNLAWVIYSVKHKEIPIAWLMMHSSLPYSKEAKNGDHLCRKCKIRNTFLYSIVIRHCSSSIFIQVWDVENLRNKVCVRVQHEKNLNFLWCRITTNTSIWKFRKIEGLATSVTPFCRIWPDQVGFCKGSHLHVFFSLSGITRRKSTANLS